MARLGVFEMILGGAVPEMEMDEHVGKRRPAGKKREKKKERKVGMRVERRKAKQSLDEVVHTLSNKSVTISWCGECCKSTVKTDHDKSVQEDCRQPA